MDEVKKDDVKAPEPTKAEAKPKEKRVKVKLLRPFRVKDEDGEMTTYDRVGSIVSVAQSDVAMLTHPKKGQVKGFGERIEEEVAHHSMPKAQLVA